METAIWIRKPSGGPVFLRVYGTRNRRTVHGLRARAYFVNAIVTSRIRLAFSVKYLLIFNEFLIGGKFLWQCNILLAS